MGGTAQTSEVAMPTSNFNPTVIGGNLGVAGDVGTGEINQASSAQATGASVAIPMMPILQNLNTQNLALVNLNNMQITPVNSLGLQNLALKDDLKAKAAHKSSQAASYMMNGGGAQIR